MLIIQFQIPKFFIKTNINGVYNLLSVAYKYWMDGNFKVKNKFINARFHQISTDEIYGSIKEVKEGEHDQYKRERVLHTFCLKG